jgi:uncharacterized membrane protein HdeD (DUF308 family)
MPTGAALATGTVPRQIGMVHWGLVLVEGIAAVIIGTLLFLAPQATVELVLRLFGLYWLVVGVLKIVSACTAPDDRGLKISMGVVGIFGGIIVIRHPLWLAVGMSAMLAVLLGAAGVVIGVLSLWLAFRSGGWGAAIGGVLSLLFGLLVLVNPPMTSIGWVYLYAGVSLIGGSVAIVLAFVIRKRSSLECLQHNSVAAGPATDPQPT